jgi:hypothetical protein
MMPDMNLDSVGNFLLGLTVYAGMVLAAFWLAMVIWAFRDMRARSRDFIAQVLVALLVGVLNIPGLVIYLMLRPRETLSEAYERSLEEEALLQEIEEKPTCPGCKQRVQESWQACPACHTRLEKPCYRCGQMLELSWNLCPYCATAQTGYGGERAASRGNGGYPASIPEAWETGYGQPAAIEFVEEE